MANSVDPDQTAPIGAVCSGSTLLASESILNLSVMLGNYLQQTTFSDAIFLGALRVNNHCKIVILFSRLLIFFFFFFFFFFFAKSTFSKNYFGNTISVSNRLDPGQARRFVGPDLDQICLQMLRADDTSRKRVQTCVNGSAVAQW